MGKLLDIEKYYENDISAEEPRRAKNMSLDIGTMVSITDLAYLIRVAKAADIVVNEGLACDCEGRGHVVAAIQNLKKALDDE